MAKLIFIMVLLAGYMTGLEAFSQRAQGQLSDLQSLYTDSQSLSTQIASGGDGQISSTTYFGK